MRLKLAQKIPLLVVLATLVTGLVVAYADYDRAARELSTAAEERLEALLESRRLALEEYLDTLRRDLRSQLANPLLEEAYSSFLVGWDEVGERASEKLRHFYIDANPYSPQDRDRLDHPNDPSIFSLAHNRFHPRLRQFTQDFGYADLLLVDATGRVIYSVKKRGDFAVTVTDRPFAATGLRRVWEAVIAIHDRTRQPDLQVFVDFSAYDPWQGRSVAFLAAPLLDPAGALTGVLVLEIPTERINRIVQAATGLGSSGDVFIVGADHMMRSDSRVSGRTTLFARAVHTAPVEAALAGGSGIMVSEEMGPDGAPTQLLAAYAPLDFLGARWAVVATADLAEVHAPVTRMRERAILSGLAVTFVVAVLGLLVVRRLVVRPLTGATEALRRLSAGDRDVTLPPVRSSDEVGDIVRALGVFRDNLAERDRLAAAHAAETRNREVRQRLAEAIEAISDGFALYDAEERLVIANSKFMQTYGPGAETLMPGTPYLDFLCHAADSGMFDEAVINRDGFIARRLEQFRDPGTMVERRLTDGRWLRIADFRTQDGGTVCIRSDITEHKQSEERFRAIVEGAADAIVTMDGQGRIVEFNKAAERIFGRRRRDVVGTLIVETLVPAEMRKGHAEGIRRYLATGELRHREQRMEALGLRADGSTFPIELTVTQMPMMGARTCAAFIRDITDRKRVEEELAAYRGHLEELVESRTAAQRQAEERLVTAIKTFKGGFALYDADEKLVLCNDQVRDFMPEVGSLLQPGTPMESITRAIAQGLGQDEAWIAERLDLYRRREAFQAERQLPDGRWIETMVDHTPDGSTLFVITDISAHKQAADALRAALERARELNQLQREFVSMTSHEFRTPLAIIDASTQRLMRRRATLGEQDFVNLGTEIRAAVARMVGLIDAILSASRLDSGEIRFAPQDCDLRHIVTEVCHRQQALTRNHVILCEVDALPDRLIADGTLLDQVVTNLLANAVKYSPKGGQVLVKGWQEGERALFSVSDQGVGIPPEDLPRLFQRFFRARTSTGIAGTGIGLNFVKRLVEMHGGGISVQSVEGAGTTFTVELPLRPPARVTPPAEAVDVEPA